MSWITRGAFSYLVPSELKAVLCLFLGAARSRKQLVRWHNEVLPIYSRLFDVDLNALCRDWQTLHEADDAIQGRAPSDEVLRKLVLARLREASLASYYLHGAASSTSPSYHTEERGAFKQLLTGKICFMTFIFECRLALVGEDQLELSVRIPSGYISLEFATNLKSFVADHVGMVSYYQSGSTHEGEEAMEWLEINYRLHISPAPELDVATLLKRDGRVLERVWVDVKDLLDRVDKVLAQRKIPFFGLHSTETSNYCYDLAEYKVGTCINRPTKTSE